MKKYSAILVIFLYVGLGFAVLRFFIADMFDYASDLAIKAGRVSDSVSYSQTSLDLNPWEASYYKTYAQSLLYKSVDLEHRKEYKSLALQNLDKAISLNPQNLATLRNTLPVYYYLVVDDLTQPIRASNLDPDYLVTYIDRSQSLQKYVPTDAGVLVILAGHYKKLGLTDLYNQTREKIEVLRPDLLNWYPTLIE